MTSEAMGKVYLVGAGPGDPKLLTLRAAEVLGWCDVVLIDRLVNRDVLRYAKKGALVKDVGKRAGDHSVKQEEICRLLVAYASGGQVVVRLKGGDPFVFGRGGEEALALVEAGIPWEVVPGVSAGIAAAAYAGIPLTHRGFASRVSFRTAHYADSERGGESDLETTVFFMCGNTLAHVAREQISSGRPPRTPFAVVRSGTCADQEVFVGTLGDALTGTFAIESPALAIVGPVVALQAKLQWFGLRASRPFSSIGTPRGATQAEESPSDSTVERRRTSRAEPVRCKPEDRTSSTQARDESRRGGPASAFATKTIRTRRARRSKTFGAPPRS
jgi:uroporphyrin-III C-methyltransferase